MPVDEIKPKKLYNGNCQCGAVRFTVRHPSLEDGDDKVMCCNCSICTRNGYLWIYPHQSNVSFTRGKDWLQSYRFATKSVAHKFCPTCGSSIGAVKDDDEDGVYCINVRVLEAFPTIMDRLTIQKWDGGREMNGTYELHD